MANVVMNKFKYQSGIAGVNLASNPLKVALINNTFYTSSTDQLADIPSFSAVQTLYETSGTGYTAGGITLSGCAVTENDTLNKMVFDADDVIWSTSTITAYGAFIYRISDSLPICLIDFVTSKTSTAGDFDISWNAAGIINLS
jgi:hypothetical protein